MQTRSSLPAGAVAVTLLAAVAACDPIASRLPSTPSAPALGGLEIVGPSSVAPNGVGQFSALVQLSDGTKKAAPSVRWIVNTSFLRLDAQGIATGQGRTGETTLTAEVSGLTGGIRRASREIVLVPDGTFRLIGNVFDAEFATTRLAGARVEAGGISVLTDSQGAYRLYGVPPQTEIQVSKSGYSTVAESVQLTTHSTRNFMLRPTDPRLTISGNYRVAFDAVGACSSLSNDLQHPRYDAVVTQNGLDISVLLTEPRFLVSFGQGNRFSGRAGVNAASFTLRSYWSYYYLYYPDLAERLPDGTFLTIDGQVEATGSASGLTGTLNGSFARYDSRFPFAGFFLGGCFSPGHQFALTPR